MPDTRTVKGCCPLDCQDTCSWVAHVADGRVVRVEGAREHPITRGALCAKVNDYPSRTYAPDRLLMPLRRVGAKGEGRFAPTSWDDAISTIASRFSAIIAEHGAEALLPVNYLGSMGIVQRRALMRLFHALGASRFYGSICGAAGVGRQSPHDVASPLALHRGGASSPRRGDHLHRPAPHANGREVRSSHRDSTRYGSLLRGRHGARDVR
jgi:anaerobic selenocysteine-containing dehydrogenase